MLGAIILAVIIVVLIPVSIAITGGVVASILGWALKQNGEVTHEGSELIDLNR
jgi:hypothetical protein